MITPKTLYKTDLITTIAAQTRLSKKDAADALNAALATIERALARGNNVTLPGFGTFYVTKRAAGEVRSIHTGEVLYYPAGKRAAFRAGEVLKQAVR